MRFAVISDIHGNLPALEAVLEDACRQSVDGFLIAGDLLARAPFPAETLRVLQSLPPDRTFFVRGNGDQYQLTFAADPAAADQFGPQAGVIRWTHEAIGQEGVDFLAGLPEEQVLDFPGLPRIHMVHASPGSMTRALVPDCSPEVLEQFRHAGIWMDGVRPDPLEQHLNGMHASLLICGHTHISWQQRAGETLVLNPGSAGMSINGDPRAQYALLEWGSGRWKASLRALPYDFQKLKEAYHRSGLLETGGIFARGFLATALSGQNAFWFFIHHAVAIARAGGDNHPYKIPDWALEKAEQTFDWSAYGI
ncbi:MAG: metallophosphoesterase family protein [Chloroflexi bacterium]|nr:metallophosphoesterase family protein [Chloroflexota bacterium]